MGCQASPKAYDPTAMAYDVTPIACDPTAMAYDVTPIACDPTAISYDLTPRAWDPSPVAWEDRPVACQHCPVSFFPGAVGPFPVVPSSARRRTMSDATLDPRYLELFPQWLRSLGEDATLIGDILAAVPWADDATRSLVAGLNYIFKSLDLIPDGIDDLGYLDDAFVIRVACALAGAARPEAKQGAVLRLGDDAAAVRDFLGEEYPRLETYVRGLRKGAARGRTVEDIVGEPGTRQQFLQEVKAWSGAYQVPGFTRDAKTLVKLKAFLNAKLP